MRLYASLLLVVSFSGILVSHALSGERYEYLGVVCDSSDAINQFVNQWDGENSDEIIISVNKNAGHSACLFGRFAVEEIARTAIVSTETGTWQLTEMKVSALLMHGIIAHFAEPTTMFTYMPINDQEI